MDSMIVAAGRALAVGDVLGALKRVALRDDPPALALRGIAMARLGDYARARDLLRAAARRFGAREAVARARCHVAEAEVALALRELEGSPQALARATAVLEARGDRLNARQARLIAARRSLLLGRLDLAEAAMAGLGELDPRETPPTLQAVAALVRAEIALRALRIGPAQTALDIATQAAERAGLPDLIAEIADTRAVLERPAARCWRLGEEGLLRLAEVEALLDARTLVIDGCRRELRVGTQALMLARRPILFALLRELALGWPGDVDRQDLIARVFRARRIDETWRARLRVEIGRLRALIAPMATIEASARGFVLTPREHRDVVVLAPPIEGETGAVRALLDDGAAWSTSALALALGASQRTVQRALAGLAASGQARAIGRARARRWLAPPLSGFTTILLLPVALATD